MTKNNRCPARSLSATQLAAATGGYTITLSYDLSSYFSSNTTLENLSKDRHDLSSGAIDNTK